LKSLGRGGWRRLHQWRDDAGRDPEKNLMKQPMWVAQGGASGAEALMYMKSRRRRNKV